MVRVKCRWLGMQRIASPHDTRRAVITAVPGASALKSVRNGTHPMPGIAPQPGGRLIRLDGPSCFSTPGTELPATSQ
jgi:hypothetical protein